MKQIGITMIDSEKPEGVDTRSLAKRIRDLDFAGKLWIKNYITA